MNTNERIQYTRLAFTLAGVQIDDAHADLAYQLCDTVRKKKGNFSLKDAVNIRYNTIGRLDDYRLTFEKKQKDKRIFRTNAIRYKRFKKKP